MSLENTAIVKHAGAKPVILEPFGNIDCFSGDVETKAEGAIVDLISCSQTAQAAKWSLCAEAVSI